ncbi:diguanylate cyclase [Dokdonella sp. MW10]|uniref:diguanylate cyclase n=1 Tax=Dokdonella sp. MW10 TaxID=2992926 RepID=UPI003F7E65D6
MPPSRTLPPENPPSEAPPSRFAGRLVGVSIVIGAILLGVAVQVYRAVGEFIDATQWVTHTLEVKNEITTIVARVRETEANQRAYIITGADDRLSDFYASMPAIATHMARLRVEVRNNPTQIANVDELEALLHKRTTGMTDVLARYHDGGFDAAQQAIRTNHSREEDLAIEALSQRMLQIEDDLLDDRRAHTLTLGALTRNLTTGAMLLTAVLLAFALALVLRENRRRLASERDVQRSNAELAGSLEESQRLARTLRQLSELGEMLQGCRSLDEALTGLRTALAHLLPGIGGSIHLVNASQDLVETYATFGEPDLESEALFGPDDCWAMRRGHAHPPTDGLAGFPCKHLGDASAIAIERALCVPMVAQGEMLGVMSMSSKLPIRHEDRSIAIAAGEHISLAIANLRLQETLRTQSLRDPLTGLFNRRYLEASLERELQRAMRRNLPMAVMMLDLDHFKRFNDLHGHDGGDALLSQFGALLQRLVRSEDVACRYGGEEFTVLLQETDAEQAMQRAARIVEAVRTLDVQHRRQSLGQVTVSIGVATYPQHGFTPEDLLRSADRALYAAKHQGRDRAVLAG